MIVKSYSWLRRTHWCWRSSRATEERERVNGNGVHRSICFLVTCFDIRVVFIVEVLVNEVMGKRGFAHTWKAKESDLSMETHSKDLERTDGSSPEQSSNNKERSSHLQVLLETSNVSRSTWEIDEEMSTRSMLLVLSELGRSVTHPLSTRICASRSSIEIIWSNVKRE